MHCCEAWLSWQVTTPRWPLGIHKESREAMSFGEFLWILLISYLLIAYLMMLFAIFSDIFRDHEMGGFVKFLWIFFLIIAPFLGALIYLVVRGRSMAQRNAANAAAMKSQQDAYIRSVAGASASPAEQIASAKALLDSGSITPAEYEAIKTKALA